MLTATISDFRKNLKEYLNKVSDNLDTLIINRGKDSGIVVLSLEAYNSLSTKAKTSSKIVNNLDSSIDSLISTEEFQKKLFEKGLEKLSSKTEPFVFLKDDSQSDWWDELSKEHKKGIQRGLEDIKQGRTVSHKDVMSKYGL